MTISLLCRTVPALVLAAALGGGGSIALAQQAASPAAPQAGAAAGANSANTPGNGSATATPGTGHAATHHAGRAAARAKGETMEQMAEQRITDLHRRLHITQQQQQQWEQFAQVMRDNAKDLDQAYQQRAGGFASMNAVQNMQSYAQIEAMRAQDLQKLVPAFQAVYDSLSDQQKQQADALFRYRTEAAEQRHAPAATKSAPSSSK